MKCNVCKKEEHLDGWDVSYSSLSEDAVLFRFICPFCGYIEVRWYHS